LRDGVLGTKEPDGRLATSRGARRVILDRGDGVVDRNVDQRHQELRSLNGLPGDIDDRVLCDLIPIGYDASDVWCLPVSLRVKPSHERQPQDTAPQDGRTSQRAFDVGQKPPTRKGGKRGEKIASDQIPWLSWRSVVVELIEEPTLADRLQRGPLAVTEALTVADQVANAFGRQEALGDLILFERAE
jgi:hypothetical protein